MTAFHTTKVSFAPIFVAVLTAGDAVIRSYWQRTVDTRRLTWAPNFGPPQGEEAHPSRKKLHQTCPPF